MFFFRYLVIDTNHHHQWQSTNPVVNRPPVIDDSSNVLYESTKEDTTSIIAHDAEEQTHNLIGEIIRKRTRKSSINQLNASTESHCDSDRVSLLSVDISISSSNLNLAIPDAKN